MEQGILLAQELHLPCVMCENDASNVVNAINDSATRTPFGHIIHDIIQAQASFTFCTFKFLSRSFKQAAHELANFAHRTDSHQVWYGVTPLLQNPLYKQTCCNNFCSCRFSLVLAFFVICFSVAIQILFLFKKKKKNITKPFGLNFFHFFQSHHIYIYIYIFSLQNNHFNLTQIIGNFVLNQKHLKEL